MLKRERESHLLSFLSLIYLSSLSSFTTILHCLCYYALSIRSSPLTHTQTTTSKSYPSTTMPLLNTPPAKPKVLVPEKLSPDGLALLRTSLDVHEKKGLSAEEILAIIPEYEALLVRSETKVTATLLGAAKNLKVVARAGVGVDNVGKEESSSS